LWAGCIAGRRFWPGVKASSLRNALIGLGMLAALLVMVLLVNRALVGDKHAYHSQQILLHDLSALSIKTGQVYLPEELALRDPPITVEKLACLYRPDYAWAVFNGNYDECSFRFKKVGDNRQFALLLESWLRAVASHPDLYVQHRLAVFGSQLEIGTPRVCYPL